jgi:hypothetical protein
LTRLLLLLDHHHHELRKVMSLSPESMHSNVMSWGNNWVNCAYTQWITKRLILMPYEYVYWICRSWGSHSGSYESCQPSSGI